MRTNKEEWSGVWALSSQVLGPCLAKWPHGRSLISGSLLLICKMEMITSSLGFYCADKGCKLLGVGPEYCWNVDHLYKAIYIFMHFIDIKCVNTYKPHVHLHLWTNLFLSPARRQIGIQRELRSSLSLSGSSITHHGVPPQRPCFWAPGTLLETRRIL